eukprot:scaffold37429_cov60-Phaeocystis_antarctica.AAC.7
MAGSDASSASLAPMRSRTSRCGKTCPFWSGCVAPPAAPRPPPPAPKSICIPHVHVHVHWAARCEARPSLTNYY